MRTVLSRAVSALPGGPTEHLYSDDGRRPRYVESGRWLRAYDPDHEEIAALRGVVTLLSPWRRTGRPEGTERQRQAQLVGVSCPGQRLWAGRVGQGLVPRTATP
ncbi:hypothetical protein ACWCQZ_50285 [Streptomyces sp. NPDC002285]